MFKVNNKSTRKWCEICSKLTLKTPEQHQWRRSGGIIDSFEHISHRFLVFLLLTLYKYMLAFIFVKSCFDKANRNLFVILRQKWHYGNSTTGHIKSFRLVAKLHVWEFSENSLTFLYSYIFFLVFFNLTVSNHRVAGEGEAYSKSFLPRPPASLALWH